MKFDQVINRYGTYSTQWDYAIDRFGTSDVLPFSISDTDFPVPLAVQEALFERLKHPIFGYTRWNHSEFKQSIIQWYEWKNCSVKQEYISYSPSVMFSVAVFIRAKSQINDGVVVFTPLYDAFINIVESNHRKLVKVPLGDAYNDYSINWNILEQSLAKKENKILLLTNPHNPTGKVFTKHEIKKIVELCQKYQIFLISDDIHMDIVYPNNKYYPILNELNASNRKNMVICTSASKTFNTPGLIGSYVLIPDGANYDLFQYSLKQQNGLSSASIMGITSQIAAYQSLDYVEDLSKYLWNNMQLLVDFFQKNNHLGLEFIPPQGTYLAWIKIKSLNEQEVMRKLIKKGHVGLMPGSTYDGLGYLRMNIACPESKLIDGLRRIELALR